MRFILVFNPVVKDEVPRLIMHMSNIVAVHFRKQVAARFAVDDVVKGDTGGAPLIGQAGLFPWLGVKTDKAIIIGAVVIFGTVDNEFLSHFVSPFCFVSAPC